MARAVGMAAVAWAACAACGGQGRAPAAVEPPEGISVAVYMGLGRAYAVVEDRRTLEVVGRRVLLDRIDRGAALSTLVIEPLGAARGALSIDQCARERLHPEPEQAGSAGGGGVAGGLGAVDGVESPLVACLVTGAPGRYRVRVHYVAASYGWEARHEIAMPAPARATISTRFTLAVPAWRARGEVVLYEGVPGAAEPPREVARGAVALDGGTAVVAPPPREVPARLLRVYDGMLRGGVVDPAEPQWGKDSLHDVRVVLELDDPALLPAPAHVRISRGGGEVYEVSTAYAPEGGTGPLVLEEGKMGREPHYERPPGSMPPARREPQVVTPRFIVVPPKAEGPKRLFLWTDPLLRGARVRTVERGTPAAFADRFELSIANTGTEPREVWIEEPLRPAKRRTVERARPEPTLTGGVARAKVIVAPGRIERVSFTIRYGF